MPFLAVEGMMITLNGGAVIVSEQPTIAPPASTSVKADNKGIFFGASIVATYPPGTLNDGAGVSTTPGVFTFSPAMVTSVKSMGQPALAMGDNAMATVTFMHGSTPTTIPVTALVQDAGQTAVQGT